MARKKITVKIADEGRDKGKTFLIEEMSAFAAERWAMRAFMAMARNGIELPEGIERSGLPAIAKMGIEMFCKIPFDDAEQLMAEMFDCVSIMPNPKSPDVIRPLIDDDIEEVKTRIQLRWEVFKLHTGFLTADA